NVGGGASVMLGNGDATFQMPIRNVGPALPRAVAAADLNRDGWPDLVLADVVMQNQSGQLAVLLGLKNAGGNFAAPVEYSASSNPGQAGPNWIAVGDFNRDAKPDIAVANTIANNVTVYLNIQK